ncbi:MAG: hypothetical protein H7251_12420, partial [Acetobacteraceae bacterium]|nr:hypothetical protein [Acetobacteraceae bacterium]
MKLIVVSAFALLAAGSASAATTVYDFAGNYTASNPSGAFAYGTGNGGSGFTGFTNSYASCFGDASFACQSVGSNASVAAVGVNTSASPISPGGTVSVPAGVLLTHPGNGGAGTDAVVKFTAPTTGSYKLNGAFERLSTVAAGNGVNVGIFDGANPLYASSALAGTGLAFGTQASFAAQPTIHHNAGDTLSFVVNNNGSYEYDSTGLLGTITGTSGTARYDAFRAFGSGNPSAAVWTYATRAGATLFSAFPAGYGNCFGSATFQCQTVGTNASVAAVGRTTALADQSLGTATLPNDVLLLHPSIGVGATDAVVRFTTPVTGKYTVAGLFERLSDAAHPFGNGVNVEVYNGGTLLFSSSTLAAPNPLSGYPTDQVSFNSIGLLTLNSGDVLSFVDNNNGEYSYDSTGLKAVVTYV